MTRLILIRHGPTHEKAMIGWTDTPADLSDTAQIARLSGALPDLPVVSSDLCRARDTAAAIAGGRPRLSDDPDLRELHFGAWEGARFSDIEATSPDHLKAFYDTPGDVAPPGGESWNALRTRVGGAVDRLTSAHRTGVIIVAHFGPILTQVQRATGKSAYDTFAQKIDNLSVSELHFDARWSLIRVNHHP